MEALYITLIVGSAIVALFILFGGMLGSQNSWEDETRERLEQSARERKEQQAKLLGEKAAMEAKLRRKQKSEVERRKATLDSVLSKTQEELQIRPSDGDSHANLGLVYVALAEWDKAKDAYERALAFGLADERKRAIVHLLYGRIIARVDLPMINNPKTAHYCGLTNGLYDTLQDFIPSESLYESWFESRDNDNDILGWMLELRGEIPPRTTRPKDPDIIRHHFEESIRLLQRHLKIDSSDIDSMRIVAGLYECTGKTKSNVRMRVLIKEAEIREGVSTPHSQLRSSNSHEKGVAFEQRCLVPAGVNGI